MGREIRRVPPQWEHPRQTCKHSPWRGGCEDAKNHGGQCYRPLYDSCYKDAADEYVENIVLWSKGAHPDQQDEGMARYKYYWDWDGAPPDEGAYRPEWREEPTWFQVYETVSEGTPVTPAFPTRRELVDYLVSYGDTWNQWRGEGGWDRASAEQFVNAGSVPSMVVEHSEAGVVTYTPSHRQVKP